ncbi:MAG: hypothetical protein J6B23_04600 [Clostridia bacterium]|nr:hypothetical protein [Clostridia bacterium]
MLKKISVYVMIFALCFSFCTGQIQVFAAPETEIGINRTLTQVRDQSCTAASFKRNASGFAGKSADDAVQTIVLSDDETVLPLPFSMINGGYPRYEITHGLDFVTNPIGTFQCSVYADGETVAALTFHWSDVLRWLPDGSVEYVTFDSETGVSGFEKVGTLMRNTWHTLALTYNHTEQLQYIYADGKLLATCIRAGGYNPEKIGTHTTMRIGAYAGSGSGMIAIDDVYSYIGEYDSESDMVTLESDSHITVDSRSASIMYNEAVISDVQSFTDRIMSLTNAKDVTVYDSKYNECSQKLPPVGYCVFTPQSGIGLRCYSLQALFAVGDVSVTLQDGILSATADVYNNHNESKFATMVIAVRNADGNIIKVHSSATAQVEEYARLLAENVEIGDGSAYIFFIDNWGSLNPISDEIVMSK